MIKIKSNKAGQRNTRREKNNYAAILVVGMLFFIFGFISWLNSMLIPYFKIICRLDTRQSMMVAFSFYFSYFVMAIPSSFLLKKTGFRNGMPLGLWIMAAGTILFVPAALTRNYQAFLFGLFVQATGLTILQMAANPYLTILGPIESAAKRISIMGVCNKIAGAVAPLILIHAITKTPDEIDHLKKLLPALDPTRQAAVLNELSSRLILPYSIMTLALSGLGLLIRYLSLPDVKEQEAPVMRVKAGKAKKNIFQFPHLLLGAVALFFGVGLEVLAVDSIITYSEYMGYSFKEGKFFATYILLVMITSYIIGAILIPRYIRQSEAIKWSAITGLLIALSAIFIPGMPSVWFIVLLGLCNALFWPCIWPLAIDGLGKFTKQGSALMIMGVVGAAVIPLLYGILSDRYNPQQAYWITIPGYLYIIFFAMKGHRTGRLFQIP